MPTKFKEAVVQIRLLLAELFLSWALSIAPDGTDEKAHIAEMLIEYCKKHLIKAV